MLRIGREAIIARLRADNPWWTREPDYDAPPFGWPRRAFYEGFARLVRSPVHRAVVLLGARRVGKTTLLLQFVGDCIRQRAFPAVLFASIDTPTYVDLSLEELLDLFAEAHPHDPAGPRLVIFDEIQYLRDWERHLKVLVDRFPRTRFVVSGSAGAALKRASTESGAGRFTDFLLPPLTFAEFLGFEKRELIEVVHGDNHRPTFICKDIHALNEAFVDYLNYGGYPEAIFVGEVRDRFDQFVGRDIVDKVLLRDLPVLYGITDIPELNKLFNVLAYNTGQEASLEALSGNANIGKPTIKRYLEYLEAAFLIYRLRRVDENARRFQRERGFKVHLANPSMRAALFAPIAPDDPAFGCVVESAVLAQWLHLPDGRHLHYARWKNGEVDAVMLDPATQRPRWALEVKWSDRIADRSEELAALADFAGRHPTLGPLAATTRSRLGWIEAVPGRPVRLVPAALLAHALGYLSAHEDRRRLLADGEVFGLDFRMDVGGRR